MKNILCSRSSKGVVEFLANIWQILVFIYYVFLKIVCVHFEKNQFKIKYDCFSDFTGIFLGNLKL